jgi:hypothetical protein
MISTVIDDSGMLEEVCRALQKTMEFCVDVVTI